MVCYVLDTIFRSRMKLYLQNDVLVVHGIYALAASYTRNHLGTCIVYLIVHVYCWIESDWIGLGWHEMFHDMNV